MEERVTALEQSHNRLVQAFNQNARVFSQALGGADAMIHVLQRIANDLLVVMLPRPGYEVYTDAQGAIDFPRYIQEYMMVGTFVDFWTLVKTWGRDDRADVQPEHDMVFGGDSA